MLNELWREHQNITSLLKHAKHSMIIRKRYNIPAFKKRLQEVNKLIDLLEETN